MSKYYIDYGTGAGNEYVNGELEDAQKAADEGAAYTQCGISIFPVDAEGNKAEEPECTRKWWSVKFDSELYENGEDTDIIDFGDFGYFDEWSN